MITGSLTLRDGVAYRKNQLAALIGRTRPTVERYAERFSFEETTVSHKGKQVSAYILTPENIEQIATALQQDRDVDHDGLVNGLQPDVVTHSQQDHDLGEGDRDPYITELELKLEAALQRIDDLKASFDKREELYKKLVSSKNDEISTLKTSMVMMERLKRYGALDVGERKPGPLARLGQWLGGFGKHSKPAASYQDIEPLSDEDMQETNKTV